MRGYDREEVEDYDDYGGYQDEDVEEEEGGEYEEGGEEYEEEEDRQPTQEEKEYLELRKRLKETIRRKRKLNGSGLSSQEKEKTLPYNNFGSFFGPSQAVISQRVIQESKSLLENQHLVSKMLSSSHSSKKNSSSNSAGQKLGQRGQVPKATSELRKKVEKLKVARDYSFLADDAETSGPAKEPRPRNFSAPTSDARSAQMLPKSKQQFGSNGSGRNDQGIREERKSVPMNGQMHSKAVSYKSSSASKPSVMSMESKKQLGVNNGNGPGRPVSASNGIGAGRPVGASNGTRPARPVGASNGVGPGRPVAANNGVGPGRPSGPKAVPSKIPIAKTEKKVSAPAAQKAPPPKMHSSGPKQHIELKKGSQERSKEKVMPQRPGISSKPQVNKPAKQVSSHSHTTSDVQRPKKKQHLSEDEKALMMIRNMFHTNRYPVYDDDDDDSDMEANFEEIQKEEKRSARIARKEDEEELRKIEEEERREELRRQAKKRKLSQH